MGDSYVEAFQVNYDKSFAEILESKLGEKNEVYRFGISGAPLSQYYHMLKTEVMDYSPDIVIVNLIHNDFYDSFELKLGRYTASFMQLEIDKEKIHEKKPIPYEENKLYMLLRGSNIFRYFHDRQLISSRKIRSLLLRLFYFKSDVIANNSKNQSKDSNNPNERISNLEKSVDYMFKNFKILSLQNGFELYFIMDGIRGDIYKGNMVDYSKTLNHIAKKYAEKHKITFLDLHHLMFNDFKKNKRRFESKYDYHWNEYGHQFVADAIFLNFLNYKM